MLGHSRPEGVTGTILLSKTKNPDMKVLHFSQCIWYHLWELNKDTLSKAETCTKCYRLFPLTEERERNSTDLPRFPPFS